MTEEEWLASSDPTPMLEFLRGKVSDRKLRLFGVACCHRILHLLTDERSRYAVELAEAFADGLILNDRLSAACDNAEVAFDEANSRVIACAHSPSSLAYIEEASTNAAWNISFPKGHTRDGVPYGFDSHSVIDTSIATVIASRLSRANLEGNAPSNLSLLRDIFGNPLRPVVADPAWLTPTVVSIASAIYVERAFNHLPILADALEEVGCTNADVLLHCRRPGEHVRGCWVVDLVLGKE